MTAATVAIRSTRFDPEPPPPTLAESPEPPLSTGHDQDFKERVRAHTDLVALAGESLTLQAKRGGREYVGLCPFHDDHNPSLTISPERQSYKCWSCGEGGDCFSWVMKIDGLEFFDALRFLAERAGLEMPKQSRGSKTTGSDAKQQLFAALSWAESQFHNFLLTAKAAEPAREYLNERGFTGDTIRRFRLGFHPNDWEWLQERARGTVSSEALLGARLIAARPGGSGYFDYFVNRVVFPVHDERGRAVAFGGRILPAFARPEDAKYINSADGPVFSKSRLLYGLDVARDAIRKCGEALVMEGYTDCITASQFGVANVVATLGTALTELHVRLLKRFARKVVLVFDADDAGRGASVRSVAKFLAQEVDLRILTLPAGADPADFIAEHGADAFRRSAAEAPEAWEFRLQAAEAEHTLTSMDARHRVLEDMLELLAEAPRLAGTLREDLILARLSGKLQAPERKIRGRLRELRSRSTGRQPRETPDETSQDAPQYAGSPSALTGEAAVERELLEMIFAHPPIIASVTERVSANEFKHTVMKELFQLCCDVWERGVMPDYSQVTSAIEDSGLKRWAGEIDELCRRKRTAELLEGDGTLRGVPPPSSLFGQLTGHFERRRRTKWSGPDEAASSSPGLTADAKARLRQEYEARQADPHFKHTPQTTHSGRQR
ncbi:MAG: DNA primase [Planctomycetaceae bacterium]